MAKQSPKDRKLRLEKGGCPVHGIGMVQTDIIHGAESSLFVVGCPRDDCFIEGTAISWDSPITLSSKFSHLIQSQTTSRLSVDCLTLGLQILKKYKPDMEVLPCHRSGRAIQVQEVEFENILDVDRLKLLELGWFSNSALLWFF